jgi:hypothetical protein
MGLFAHARRYLEGRFNAGRTLHKRIIRTQQTAKLQARSPPDMPLLLAH